MIYNDDIRNRLRRIEGQARGVQRLLAEDASCEAIITQLAAMKSALHHVGIEMIHCLLEGAGESPETVMELERTIRLLGKF